MSKIACLSRLLSTAAVCCLFACAAGDGDSRECKRYKAALLENAHCDPAFAPPPVNDSYDAYRCPSADEFVEEGNASSLGACADQLEQLAGPSGACEVPISSAERLMCKTALIYTDESARLSAKGVGTTCALSFSLSAETAESVLELPSQDCSTGACLVHAGETAEDAYCTCRCDTGDAHLPTCECPGGFVCAENLVDGGERPGFGGGYCVRQ
jgi:hypothetical protein